MQDLLSGNMRKNSGSELGKSGRGIPEVYQKLRGCFKWPICRTRTFSERMFHVMTLGRLAEKECREAILKPIAQHGCPVRFTDTAVSEIVKYSGGYPYFIQFLCREMFDSYLQQKAGGEINPVVTVVQTIRKLDSDFFAGRWNRVTDRQRELLSVAAQLPNCDDEFTVQEVVEQSHKGSKKPFSPSHVNQILAKLADNGLVYKNRHGRYLFAVPLLGGFIRRQEALEGA
jgi:hypothetical protein